MVLDRASRIFLLAAVRAKLLLLFVAIFWLVPTTQALRPSAAVQPLIPSLQS